VFVSDEASLQKNGFERRFVIIKLY